MDPSLTDLMPFAKLAGVELLRADASGVLGALDWSDERCTAGGVLHGGAIMTLADSVAAVCAYLNLPSGARTATIEATTHFLRALSSGRLLAESAPVHLGRTIIVLETRLTNDQGQLIAHTLQTQAVRSA